jgi:hypothetical protein
VHSTEAAEPIQETCISESRSWQHDCTGCITLRTYRPPLACGDLYSVTSDEISLRNGILLLQTADNSIN